MPRNGTPTRERILDSAERLILDRGFAATTIDAILADAGTTKGAFFHHFASKAELARSLVDRYAAADIAALDAIMMRAEAESEDPAEQVIAFVRLFEETAEELASMQPGCLYVSYMYEKQLFDDGTNDTSIDTVKKWRERLHAKLEAAAEAHPPRLRVELGSLADQVFTIFEGGFILARTMNDPTHLRAQLTHLRHYLQLLFALEPTAP